MRDLQLHGTSVISRYYFSDDRECMQFIQDLLDAGFQPPDARPSAGSNAFSRPLSHYMPRAQGADSTAGDPRSIIAHRPTSAQLTPPTSAPEQQDQPPYDPYNVAEAGVVVRGGWPVHDGYNTKPKRPSGGPPMRTRPF